MLSAVLAVIGLGLLGWAFVMRRQLDRSDAADTPVNDWPDDEPPATS